VIGDVSGKGISSAILMAKLSSDTRYSFLSEANPVQAVSRLNDQVYEYASPTDRFVTLLAVVLDPSRHLATLVSAGFPSPLLFRQISSELSSPIPKCGNALGMVKGSTYEAYEVMLDPGDSLLLYSDGITDGVSDKGVQFGVGGIYGVLKAEPLMPTQIGHRTIQAVRRHTEGRQPNDDQTLVCVGRVAPALGASPSERWHHTAEKLRNYQRDLRERWGVVDAASIGRYLSGSALPDEACAIEAAAMKHSDLANLLNLLGKVIRDQDGSS
jgi:hypothetical protein